MIIRLGYVAISNSIPNSTSSPYPLTKFKKEKDYQKLIKITNSNLEALEETLIYNIKNQIHFYRISSNLIPLATAKEVNKNKIKSIELNNTLEKIGILIDASKMRVDFHPNQYCVLNSTKKEVISSSIQILKYHYKLLQKMKIKKKIIVLHIGSSTDGKINSIKRFLNTFDQLPKYLQNTIAIENDDKVFNIEDCLYLSRQRNIPIVLDYHHHNCNPTTKNLDIYLNEIFSTWKRKKLPPKIHFSSPKNKKDYRAHNEYIDSNQFIKFLNKIKKFPYNIDIMLEAKAKDDALFRLIRELKYKEKFYFLDETTIKI